MRAGMCLLRSLELFGSSSVLLLHVRIVSSVFLMTLRFVSTSCFFGASWRVGTALRLFVFEVRLQIPRYAPLPNCPLLLSSFLSAL